MGKKSLAPELISKVKLLRNHGYSLSEISEKLHIAKTTVFRYIVGVEIQSEFLATWIGKRGGSKKRKQLKETKALEEGQSLVGKLSVKEKLLFVSALYWAEGSKNDFGLSNTDPALIKVFIEGMKDIFGLKENQFRISIRIYEDLDREKCLDFWSKVTGIPQEQFVNVNVLSGKKIGKLEYGMCRVRVAKGGDLLKKIAGINKAVYNTIVVPIA